MRSSKQEAIIRLDHIAYRVANREKTVKFFMDALGYTFQTEFDLEFADGTTCDCTALEPPEKHPMITNHYWVKRINDGLAIPITPEVAKENPHDELHLPPEIFVSEGQPGSIVADWVAARNGVGGIHHLAYQVDDVKATMAEWVEKGYAEFTSDKPMECPGLTQVFTKPSELTGVIYEFITRSGYGFCKENVRGLMESTVGVGVDGK